MFKLGPRIRETTATTGTGTLNLAGATTGMQTFVAGIGTTNTTRYCLVSGNGADWEIGIGTVTSGSPDTLSRDTVLASTNSGAKISLTGTSRAFCVLDPYGASGLFNQVLSAAPTSVGTGLTTWANQSGATVADGSTGIVLQGSASSNVISIRSKAVPSLPYSIDVLIEPLYTSGNVAGPLFGWYDGTKIQAFAIFTSASLPIIYVIDYATLNSGAGAATIRYTSPQPVMQNCWLRIRDDNAGNILFQLLPGGNAAQAVTVYTVAKASGYLSAYSNVFFGINRTGSIQAATMYSYRES